MQKKTLLPVLIVAVWALGCENNDRYWAVYWDAYHRAHDIAYKEAYPIAFEEAYEAVEPVAFAHMKTRLIAVRDYSWHPGLLTAAGLVGTLLGFLAQYGAFAWLRRARYFREKLDNRLLGMEPSTVPVRRDTAVKVVAVCLLFSLFVGCDGGEAQGRRDGERDGTAAGTREGTVDGHRDGSAQGNAAGESRALIAARKGTLPEIYVTPILIMLIVGIALGIQAQLWLIRRIRRGIAVPEPLALILIPGLTRTKAYRASKADEARERRQRLDALGSSRLLGPGSSRVTAP